MAKLTADIEVDVYQIHREFISRIIRSGEVSSGMISPFESWVLFVALAQWMTTHCDRQYDEAAIAELGYLDLIHASELQTSRNDFLA